MHNLSNRLRNVPQVPRIYTKTQCNVITSTNNTFEPPCSHPQPESRPTFTNILGNLQRPDYQLLNWASDDVSSNSEAAKTLGAPLDEGFSLYKDLQNTYIGPAAESSL